MTGPAETLVIDLLDDPVIGPLTMRAVVASTAIRATPIRCHRLGCLLGYVGPAEMGALFTSSWPARSQSYEPTSYVADERGTVIGPSRPLKPRRAARMFPLFNLTTEIHGTVALLILPLDVEARFPDLLVRCEHGDAVLSPAQVIGWARNRRAPRIRVEAKRHAYTMSRRGLA